MEKKEKNKNDFLLDKKFGDKELDYIVCVCMGVSYSDIVNEIQGGTRTFKELYDKLGVGSGCGACKQDIKDILEKELKKLGG